MISPSNLRTRAALATVCAVILFAAAGCSVTFGPIRSPAGTTTASPEPSATESPTASALPLCTDLSTEDQVDFTDVTASMAYWDQVVADAPSDIVDQAQAVEDGFRKIADGMSANDEENNNAINDAINALESWSADNCLG